MAAENRTTDPRRRADAWVLAVAGPALLVGALLPAGGSAPLAAALMVLLAVTLVVTSFGGRTPGLVAAVLGLLLAGAFLVGPAEGGAGDRIWDLVALGGFAVLAFWSIHLVDRSAAARAGAAAGTGV